MTNITPETREKMVEVFRSDDDLTVKLWHELPSVDPELQRIIEEEGLRLFPDHNNRATATRFVLEIVQTMRVNELENGVALD